MKILLVNPPKYKNLKYIREGRCQQRVSSYEYVFPPISLFSIASLLERENFDVKIIDSTAENISWFELEEIINKYCPDTIVASISTPSFYGDIKISEISNKLNIFSIAIGVHCTALPEQTLIGSKFDAVVRGEPEISVLEIIKKLNKESDNFNLKNLLGISYKKWKNLS